MNQEKKVNKKKITTILSNLTRKKREKICDKDHYSYIKLQRNFIYLLRLCKNKF